MSQITLTSPPNADTYSLIGSTNWLVNARDITINATKVDLTAALCWNVNACNIYVNAQIDGVQVLDNLYNLSSTYWNNVPNLSIGFVNLSQNFYSLNSVSNTFFKKTGDFMTGDLKIQSITEQVSQLGTGTSLTVDFPSVKSVVFFSPSQNFTMTINNVPVVPNTTCTLTCVYNTKFYCNTVIVNGTQRTVEFNGGTSNISINTAADYVLQCISICFFDSTVVVFSSVNSYF